MKSTVLTINRWFIGINMFSNTAQYDFEWDKTKDETNLIKHGISFASATEIFLDPLAISQFDISHSIYEERWWTIGTISIGKLVVISHTFKELAGNRFLIRLISARFATKKERLYYEVLQTNGDRHVH